MLLPALSWGAPEAPVVLVFGDSLAAGYGLPQSQSWAYLLGKQLAPFGRVADRVAEQLLRLIAERRLASRA